VQIIRAKVVAWLSLSQQVTHYKEVKVVTGGSGEAGDLSGGQVGDQEIRRYDREGGEARGQRLGHNLG